jgi:hypothetical protein
MYSFAHLDEVWYYLFSQKNFDLTGNFALKRLRKNIELLWSDSQFTPSLDYTVAIIFEKVVLARAKDRFGKGMSLDSPQERKVGFVPGVILGPRKHCFSEYRSDY